MSDGTAVLELRNISRNFTLPNGQNLEVLRQLNLEVSRGEVVAIVGRSGSGKSTLLNILGLLDLPSSGSYFINKQDASRLSDAQRAHLRGEFLGFVFQQFHLLDRRTALENVAEPLLFASRKEMRQRWARAEALLHQVGLAERIHSMPHLLSGGEQQRVAIARAMVRQPDVILADEPTGALDEVTGEQILESLFSMVRKENVALILVTHDPTIAARADRTLTLTAKSLVVESMNRSK